MSGRHLTRPYGSKINEIRAKARAIGRVTWRDFDLMHNSRVLLHIMAKSGELRLVKRGTPGCKGRAAVYELAHGR